MNKEYNPIMVDGRKIADFIDQSIAICVDELNTKSYTQDFIPKNILIQFYSNIKLEIANICMDSVYEEKDYM